MPRIKNNLKKMSGSGPDEDLRALLNSMSKEALIEILMKNPGVVKTTPIDTNMARSISVNQLEQGPEVVQESYKMPEKTHGSALGFFEDSIYDKLYDGFLDESEYPNEKTCEQVKRLCNLDPLYCKKEKFKEKYHKLCMEIRKTLVMIDKSLNMGNKLERVNSNSSLSSSGSKDIYEIDEYIDLINNNKYRGKKIFDDDVIDCLKEHIDDVYGDSRRTKIYTTGGEDLSWSDLETILMDSFNENNLKEFMYQFGIKLHKKNPNRYYPFIVEKIKQKILREYFM